MTWGDFVNRIAELRKIHKLSQYELGQILGAAQNSVSNWEKGTREPDNATLSKLAEIFNVTIDYLLGRTDDPSPPGHKKSAPSDISTEEALMIAFTDMLGREPTERELKQFLEIGKIFFGVEDKPPD